MPGTMLQYKQANKKQKPPLLGMVIQGNQKSSYYSTVY